MDTSTNILKGAYDLHVHCEPDLLPRSVNVIELAKKAKEYNMAGIGIKSHCFPTTNIQYIINKLYPDGPKIISSVVLNPTIGGFNSCMVDAAIKDGVDIVYFPTYAAEHHINFMGNEGFDSPMPISNDDFKGLYILDNGKIIPDVKAIVKKIANNNKILATGHISPKESLLLLEYAMNVGVKKMIVTHASELVPNMSIEDQKKAVSFGAYIEHSFLAIELDDKITIEHIANQIRQVGVSNVILTSDFGKANLVNPIEGFKKYLLKLLCLGFSRQEIDIMIKVNPISILE